MTSFAKMKGSSLLVSLVLKYLKYLNSCPQFPSPFAEALSLLPSELTFKARVGSYCLETQDLSWLNFTSTLDTYFLRPDYPATKAGQRHCKKRQLQANILDEFRCKNSQENTTIHHDQVGFTPGIQEDSMFADQLICCPMLQMKDTNHMKISMNAEKAFDKFNTIS